MTRVLRVLILFLVATFILAPAAFAQPARPAQPAQAPQTGKLIITVVDQSRLVIPGAAVTVVGLDDATKKAPIAPMKSSDKGVATFDGLTLGRYSVSGEFAGFEIGVIREIRLKAGENKSVLVLPLAKMTEEITVGRDKQTVASDRGATFGSALTREQIEALSDDPDEMAKQLQDMAGPGAAMRVDSFEGAQLPPKAMIKAIHITRDSFAAETHEAGGMFIDIITQPGVRPTSGMARFGFADSALDGRNPLVQRRGPAQNQNYGVGIGGTLIKEKSGYSISANASHSFSTPNLFAATPTGNISQNLDLRQPRDSYGISGSLDYAITKDQTVRLAMGWNTFSTKNQGVGGYNLAERAWSSDSRSFFLRMQEAGPVGRRFFINTRFMMNWSDSNSSSATEAPTINVLDSFIGGGAQQAGGSRTKTYSLQSDLDYVRGRHSFRMGISIDGGTYQSNNSSNYLGTYVFSNLASYEAGQPRNYTQRMGNPNIQYQNWQAGLYIQDDIRVSKNLTLSPGMRFEAQTHVTDTNNIGPRFGMTWSPFKSGKTTLRLSFGQFYDWLGAGTYEQTLRIDGIHQRELNVTQNPTFPYDGSAGLIPPTNKYLLEPDYNLARNTRLSAGIDQQITPAIRINAIYSDTKAHGVLVGQNLNTPVNGIRPDPTLVNEVEAIGVGSSRSRSLSTYTSLNLAPKGGAGGAIAIGGGGGMIMVSGGGGSSTGPFFSLRRGLSLNLSYTLAKSENNVDGAFSVSPTGTLATEWGPSNFDVRHRFSFGVNSSAIKNLSITVYVSASSGSPYSIRTGQDNNGDGMFNDRPAGVGRNTLRAGWQWNSFGMFSYTIGFGKKTLPTAGGIDIATIARAAGVSIPNMGPMAPPPRYRLSIGLNVNNLTNHANYVGYSGTMTSQFFMKPTMVSGVRTFNLNAGLSF